MTINKHALIGIVGPCGSGKSTLTQGLLSLGYNARAIAQEHSYVPTMWQRITNPDLLIFLQASHQVGALRRKMIWSLAEWEEQQHRLRHARSNASFFLDTDQLGIEEVRAKVCSYIDGVIVNPDISSIRKV